MSYQFGIEVKGAEELMKLFSNFKAVANRRLLQAMQKSVLTIENAVSPLAPVGVSGRLRGSIASEVEGVGSEIVGRVGSNLRDEVYPKVMEHGREPGRMPPPEALERWVHLKLGVPTDEAPGVAFVVARNIARRGIKGRFFLRRGWEKAQKRVIEYFKRAQELIVKDLKK